MGFPFGLRKMFSTKIQVFAQLHVLNTTELFTLKQLILCDVNFTWIKRKKIPSEGPLLVPEG